MFAFRHLVLCTFLLGAVLSRNLQLRRAKSFREPYTTTIIQEEFVTKLVPSSCILVKHTLPPCREIRFLKFPILWGYDNNTEKRHGVDSPHRSEPTTQGTSMSWGEYFGIYRPTVTVTQAKRVTTTVKNPKIVVTFSLVGCRPSSLPEQMERCSEFATDGNFAFAHTVPPYQPTVIPTPTIPMAITNMPNFEQPIYDAINNQVSPNVLATKEVHDISPFINEHQDENQFKATEELSQNV